jgi:hypothetical protein
MPLIFKLCARANYSSPGPGRSFDDQEPPAAMVLLGLGKKLELLFSTPAAMTCDCRAIGEFRNPTRLTACINLLSAKKIRCFTNFNSMSVDYGLNRGFSMLSIRKVYCNADSYIRRGSSIMPLSRISLFQKLPQQHASPINSHHCAQRASICQ